MKAIASVLFLASTLVAQAAAPRPDATADFHALVDVYFDEYFRLHPTDATAAGLHQYDHLLEDYSRAGVDARIAVSRRYAAKFAAIDPKGLKPLDAADREIVLSNIQAHLLDLEQVRFWEKHPDLYSSEVNESVFLLASRTFAPATERLKAVVARERKIPQALAAARVNLKNPPHIFTEIALQQLPGVIGYFEDDLPASFVEVKDERLLAEFRAVNRAAVESLQAYRRFLEDDVLPRSKGDFRLGEDVFRKKLLYEEMIDIPLDRLRKVAYENLRANQEAFRRTAAKLDRKRTPAEILEQLTKDHPAPGELLSTVRKLLDGQRRFIIEKKLLTIPSPRLPIVAETPPFKRALSWASMETPGPYETKATEAFYFLTLPQPGWPAERVEEHMRGYNRGTLTTTSIHEAYPGHYVQFLWVQHAPSKVRKLIGSTANAEGWAHYVEQMMLDEGYGGGDPTIRLGQLQDALLRNARFVASIEMHAGKMTRDEAADFFVKEGYQTRANAVMEANRGTTDATYLVYTLGKLAVLKLRDDYRQFRGPQFSLQEFHNEFLKQGFPPIKLIRRAMLGKDGEML